MSRKKHGHHGGAWKVAYADFVTAMMALFLVLWLTSQDVKIKEAVERAFKNPFASLTKEGTGIIPSKDKNNQQVVQTTKGSFSSASAVELTMLRRINEDLMRSLQSNPEVDENKSVEMELTPEGLRINIFDRGNKPIFEPFSTRFTEYGGWVFSTLAWEISRYASFLVELEGHTEKMLEGSVGAEIWEISANRANAARKKLEEHGVTGGQIRKIAGYADTIPMPHRDPMDEVNRRVSVLLRIASAN
jgi:chemotaxis protein MotB